MVKKNSKQRGKKAQLKIQQMAFVLIALTLFFVLVGLFILAIKLNSLGKEASTLEEEKVIQLLSKISNSAEFSCGEIFSSSEIACIDADKTMALKSLAQYSDFWGIGNLEIRKIYPETQNVECTLNNYPNCNVIKIVSNKEYSTYYSNFVSLCRREINAEGNKFEKCEIGEILVSPKK